MKSKLFQNVHVEVLYQRYFLRMNQNNMTSLLILLVLIAVTMIVVNFAISSADSIMQVSTHFNISNFLFVSLSLSVSLCLSLSLSVSLCATPLLGATKLRSFAPRGYNLHAMLVAQT